MIFNKDVYYYFLIVIFVFYVVFIYNLVLRLFSYIGIKFCFWDFVMEIIFNYVVFDIEVYE